MWLAVPCFYVRFGLVLAAPKLEAELVQSEWRAKWQAMAVKKKVDIRSYFLKKPVSHKVKIVTEMSPTTLMTTRLCHCSMPTAG